MLPPRCSSFNLSAASDTVNHHFLTSTPRSDLFLSHLHITPRWETRFHHSHHFSTGASLGSIPRPACLLCAKSLSGFHGFVLHRCYPSLLLFFCLDTGGGKECLVISYRITASSVVLHVFFVFFIKINKRKTNELFDEPILIGSSICGIFQHLWYIYQDSSFFRTFSSPY